MSHVCLHSPSKRRQGVACERCLLDTGCLLQINLSDSSSGSGRRGRGKARQTSKTLKAQATLVTWRRVPRNPVHWLPFLPCGLANTCLGNSPRSSQPLPKVSICLIIPTTLFKLTLSYPQGRKSVCEFSFPSLWTRASLCPHPAK